MMPNYLSFVYSKNIYRIAPGSWDEIGTQLTNFLFSAELMVCQMKHIKLKNTKIYVCSISNHDIAMRKVS